MSEKTLNKETAAYDGSMLWDEILKAIVDTMPEQLFPLFKEVYGKAYPEGTSIALLKTETSTFWENVKEPPNSTLMDIALVVGGTDYYHLECQMKNDHEMVIRMFAYDVHFAITHTKNIDGNSGEITLRFPHSAVIYPAKNSTIPDHLQCRILFQDNSEHIYQIPTVRIQSYSLAEIGEKHLTLFLPYTILREYSCAVGSSAIIRFRFAAHNIALLPTVLYCIYHTLSVLSFSVCCWFLLRIHY